MSEFRDYLNENKEKVKIKGKKVFLNGEEIGERSFIRYQHKSGIDINGYFIFEYNGKKYRFDTSNYGYSKDADKYIRYMLESGQIESLANASKELK